MVQLPEKVKYIIESLEEQGFEAYAVGGCVRDSILGRTPMDWDITTSALPEQVKACFKRTIDTGIQHGTVTVMLDKEGFEITTYRLDGDYEDGRHPKEVTFTSNLIEDLKRRDFTINAMAYNDRVGIVDEFDGIGDLKRGIIKCVGVPEERFGEDALRMMRAVRFAAQLGFEIEDRTKQAIVELADTLKKVSAERIQVELVKLLVSDHPEEVRTLYETGLTAIMLPEFDVMMTCTQNTPHHCYTVGEHTIAGLRNIRNDKVLRITMLLHDVSKPECKTTDANGREHFKGHPAIGEKQAIQILKRLKFDNDTIKKVAKLVRYHDDKPELNIRNVRRAIVRVGEEFYPEFFEVLVADRLAQSEYKRQEKLEYVEEYKKLYCQIVEEKNCLKIADLKVNGSDLMELGVERGPRIGQVLNELLELVLDCPEKNNREELLDYIKGII